MTSGCENQWGLHPSEAESCWSTGRSLEGPRTWASLLTPSLHLGSRTGQQLAKCQRHTGRN